MDSEYQFMDWYIKCLRDYATFTGRAPRIEYWMFMLFNIIAALFIQILDALFYSAFGVSLGLKVIYSIAILIPTVAVTVRRIHDAGSSGWWALLLLIPVAGWFALLVFTLKESEHGANEYGPEPRLPEWPMQA